jgi:hypothetical protein
MSTEDRHPIPVVRHFMRLHEWIAGAPGRRIAALLEGEIAVANLREDRYEHLVASVPL